MPCLLSGEQGVDLVVCGFDVSFDIHFPGALYFGVVVQVELVVDNRPLIGLNFNQGILSDTVRTVSTVLGSILLGVTGEEIKVLFRREFPGGALPFCGVVVC